MTKKTPKSFYMKYFFCFFFTITYFFIIKSDPYLYALMSFFTTFQIQNPILKKQHKNLVCNFKN